MRKFLLNPIDLVYHAFTDSLNIQSWWGPNGFTTTTESRDFKIGGEWVFKMVSKDGTVYPNVIKYKSIKEKEYLEYLHGSGSDSPNDDFLVKIWFSPTKNNHTIIKMKMIFSSAEKRNIVVNFGAIDGAHQTLSKLNFYLTK